jgi:stage V sporulation protein S
VAVPHSQANSPDDSDDGSPQIKISTKSNPKLSAGSIAHALRRGDSPNVICTGHASVNQAIKAIAIARGFLAGDNINIVVRPTFRDIPQRLRMVFSIQRGDDEEVPTDEAADLRVGQNSQFSVVAGAIAKKVRSGEPPYIACIGANAVAIAVLSIVRSRLYLRQDQIDVVFRPQFVHVTMKDEARSAIRFAVLPRSIGGPGATAAVPAAAAPAVAAPAPSQGLIQ